MRNFTFLLFAIFVFSTAGISQTKDKIPCIDKTFSIVVHIVYDSLKNPNISEATIQGLIPTLNTNFAPICASFSICEFKYINNFAYDRMNIGQDWPEVQNQYNIKNRINLYFVSAVLGSPYCGSADLGGITELNKFGIVMSKTCLDAKTLSQQMGRYFGLKYTYEGSGTELADGSNCSAAGDQICDTPADPYIEGDLLSNYITGPNCKFISMKKDAKGQYYSPLVGNIMSGYPCLCGFTNEQYIKMATVYLSKTGIW